MTAAAGALYRGQVSHRRFRPRAHRLRYSIFQILIDIDAAPRLLGALRLFSHNRFNLFGFYDADHGDGRAGALRGFVDEALAKAGIDISGGKVRLLTMPRVLGHVFNPISLFFCRRAGGDLAAMIYEVNNTFGERHFYVIPAVEAGGEIVQSCAKRFYVSPFMDMAMTYEFRVTTPGQRITVCVDGRDEKGEPLIATCFTGQREDLTDLALAGAFLGHPLMTLKVVAAIHFEAVRLLFKGLRLRRRPAPPSHAVTVVG